MDKILGNAKIRKLFYLLFFLVLFTLIAMKFFFNEIPYFNTLLDELIASIITTVLLGTFAFYVFPSNEDLDFKIIEATKIQEELAKGRITTDYWYFTGGTGIFTKAVTLPELARFARIKNKPIEIKLQIIDPLNIDLCEKYAIYRRGLNTAATAQNRKMWNSRYVRNQSFATIVKSIIITSQEPLLEISVGLKNNFSLFRLDLCSTSVIVTKEDPREVAFIFYKQSSSFNSYFHEFKETYKQTKEVKKYITDINLIEIDKPKLIFILEAVDLYVDLNDSDLDEILDLVKNSVNPYA